MSDYIIENDKERAFARIIFSGTVSREDVARAYRDVMSGDDLTRLHRFLWDFRDARLDALSDKELHNMACGTNGGRHPHSGEIISDAIVVDREQDYERIVRWRDIAWEVSGVMDWVFSDYDEAVRWLLTRPDAGMETARAWA